MTNRDVEYAHLDGPEAHPLYVVWSRVEPQARAQAKHWLGKERGLSPLEAAKEVNYAIVTGGWLQATKPLLWDQAVIARDGLVGWAVIAPEIAQQGYEPSPASAMYCPDDRVWYSGILGCPRCGVVHAL